jgi:calcium-dependent protein kinase
MQMDSNRDGIVDFDEFVAATLHVHQLEETDSEKWQKRSRAAFNKFDFDGDGYITAEELKIVSVGSAIRGLFVLVLVLACS